MTPEEEAQARMEVEALRAAVKSAKDAVHELLNCPAAGPPADGDGEAVGTEAGDDSATGGQRAAFEVEGPRGRVDPRARHGMPTGALVGCMALTLACWFGLVVAGALTHVGRANLLVSALPLLWFDKILRTLGSLVPLALALLRCIVWLFLGLLRPKAVGAEDDADRGRLLDEASRAAPASGGEDRHPHARAPEPVAAWAALPPHALVAVLRLGLYLAHLAAQKANEGDHIVSDHILLAASVIASLQVELLLTIADITAWVNVGAAGAASALALVFGADAVVMALVAGDMFFTARHFHHPLETLLSLFMGFLVFHVPMLMWLGSRLRAALLARGGASDSTARGDEGGGGIKRK